jgi:hypothetical protein
MHAVHRTAGGQEGGQASPEPDDDERAETRDYVDARAHLPDLVAPLAAQPGDYVHGLLLTGAWPRDGATATGYRRRWMYSAQHQSWRCLEAPS